MLIRSPRPWELPEREATPESLYLSRRRWLQAAGLTATSLATASLTAPNAMASPYAPPRNTQFSLDRPITDEYLATNYCNFYEFGSHKSIQPEAQKMTIDPWRVEVSGEVNRPQVWDFEKILNTMPMEERLYRFRCVETWSMAVPWVGFPLAAWIRQIEPSSQARYVKMTTLIDKKVMPGLRQAWYPWPYVEGLTMEEAMNPLTLMVVGMYGKASPRQNGAPLRLIVPWKYGFKSVKSIVKLEFVREQPQTFWQKAQGREYGFWANVNPEVPHRRWSQSTEQMLGEDGRRPTLLYNGYGEYVADLYRNIPQDQLFF